MGLERTIAANRAERDRVMALARERILEGYSSKALDQAVAVLDELITAQEARLSSERKRAQRQGALDL